MPLIGLAFKLFSTNFSKFFYENDDNFPFNYFILNMILMKCFQQKEMIENKSEMLKFFCRMDNEKIVAKKNMN